ncbi:MAG: O-antigen ligase family protein [Planctomycetota bacterium]
MTETEANPAAASDAARYDAPGDPVESDGPNDGLDDIRRRARDRDPRGHTVHAWLAAFATACLTGPTSLAEFALAPVLLMYVLRTWCLRDVFWHTFREPIVLAVLAFAAWLFLGMLWTDAEMRTALDEPANLRWCFAIGLFWPVLDRRRLIIGGLVVGLVAGQLVQLYHGLGEVLGFETPFDRFAGRVSGWWDPAVSGGVLTVAFALQVPTAFMGSGRARWTAIALAVIAAAGLVATGARGGWLAAMGVAGVTLLAAVRTGKGRNAALVCLAAGVVGVGVGAVAPPIRERVTDAVQQVRTAVSEGDYSGDVSARIGMMVWSGRAFLDQPLVGQGTSGYSQWAGENGAEGQWLHQHAHNTWTHLAGCNGVIGVGLFGVLMGAAFAGAWTWARGAFETVAAAPLFALLGLLLFTMFDVLHASGQTAAMLAALLALSMPKRGGQGGPGERAAQPGGDA